MAICVIIVSCKKDVDELPPITQTGANTFGANVNGELWVPAGFGIAQTSPKLEVRYLPGRDIIINARNFSSSPTETEFEIYLRNVTTPGVYLLNTTTGKYPNSSGNYAYYLIRKITPTDDWITSSQFTGRVEITKTDTVNRIVSGTFEFTAQNINPSSSPLTVTDGRFDLKIQ